MAMYHSLNYSSHISGSISKHRIQNRRKIKPDLFKSPSAVILQTDEGGDLPDYKKRFCSDLAMENCHSNKSIFSQTNAVGIIGGVSTDCTLNFVRKLEQRNLKDDQNVLPFVLCSDPDLSKELLCYEKSSFSLASNSPQLPMDQTLIIENLRRKSIFLEKSGVCCIAMLCHISHSWHEELSKGCSVPFLHVGECVAKELKDAKLRPLEAGSTLRIGVLASNATLMAGFFQEKLQNEGFEAVLPDKATMEHIVIPATEALSRNDMEGARNLLRIALQALLVRAVNAVILASSDLRELLPYDDPLLKKCIDPLDALARETIKCAQTGEKVK